MAEVGIVWHRRRPVRTQPGTEPIREVEKQLRALVAQLNRSTDGLNRTARDVAQTDEEQRRARGD